MPDHQLRIAGRISDADGESASGWWKAPSGKTPPFAWGTLFLPGLAGVALMVFRRRL